jgi:hypothetical protein
MRSCCICGNTNELVDIYQIAEVKGYGPKSNRKAIIPEPKTYCDKHFMEYVWNKKEDQND